MLSILSKALQWRPNHRKKPSLLLFAQVEKSIIQGYFEDMESYVTGSQRSSQNIVMSDKIFFEKLRGVQLSTSFCYRVLLSHKFQYSKLLCRMVHNLNHYASVNTQLTMLKSLGYMIENAGTYLEKYKRTKCMRCLREMQKSQVNEFGSVARCILRYERPFKNVAADCSFWWYFQNRKIRKLCVVQHFLCLETQAVFSAPQESCSTQSFFNSLLQLASWTSKFPSLCVSDQGSDFLSASVKMLNLDELNTTRQATKQNTYKHLMDNWTDRDLDNLKNLTASKKVS